MKIISFGWTTPALLAGEKTVTRRDWKRSHAERFHDRDLVQAWSKSPRAGGRKVATIMLTGAPEREYSNEICDLEWWPEGFQYLTDQHLLLGGHTPQEVWYDWTQGNPRWLWVVRFVVLGYDEG